MKNAKALAGKGGKLIVGILTDEAIMEKESKPITSFSDRVSLAEAIEYVDIVVAQETYSPVSNILNLSPDILCEDSNHSKEIIEEARKVIESINGRVIVLPHHPKKSK